MNSDRRRGRWSSQLLLCSLLAVLIFACQDADPQLLAPLSSVSIRAITADALPYETEFEITSARVGSRSFMRAQTTGGVAQLSLPPGQYRVRDRETGAYLAGSVPVMLEDSAEPIGVGANQAVDVAFRYAALHVRLRNEEGEAVAWRGFASQLLIEPRSNLRGQVLGDSVITISPLVPDILRVGASNSGTEYPLTWYPDVSRLADATPLSFAAGELKAVEITVRRGGWLRMTAPAPDRVIALGLTPDHLVQISDDCNSTFDREQGAATVVAGPVHTGTKDVFVTVNWENRGTSHSVQRYIHFTATFSEAETISVEISSVQGIEVESESGAQLSLSGSDRGSTVARSHGPVLLLYAEPGDYILDGDAEGSLPTFWPGALHPDAAEVIEIPPDSWTRLDFPLIHEATIRGRVLAEDGSLHPVLAMTEVNLFANGDSTSTRPDASGRFAFHELRPGMYKLRVDSGPETGFAPTWYGDTVNELNARSVKLAAGDWIDAVEIRQRRR